MAQQSLAALRITITIGTECFTLTSKNLSVTFSDITQYIGNIQRKPSSELEDLVLRCCGCRRRVWFDEENFQPIPSPCCRVRSLMLEEAIEELPKSSSDGSKETVSLTVSLPDTATQPFCVPTSISIDDLLKKALHGRPRVPISDVRTTASGSVMVVGTTWRELPLSKCGVAHGDDVTVVPAAPKKVYVMVCEPHRPNPTDSAELRLEPGEWNWRSIRRKAQRYFKVPLCPYTTASQFVRFYEGEGGRRRAIWSYREEPEEELFFSDEETAKEVDRRKAPQSVLEFLSPSGGLRWAPNKTPLVQIDINSDFLRMACDGSYEDFDPTETIFLPKWLVMLLGYRYWSASGWHIFIRIRGGLIFDQQSGEEFADIKMVLRSHNRIPHGNWRKIFLFLQDGDSVPKGNVPIGRTVAIYRREGLDLDVEENCLKLRGASCAGNDSAWTVPTDQIEFDEKFMKEMRR